MDYKRWPCKKVINESNVKRSIDPRHQLVQIGRLLWSIYGEASCANRSDSYRVEALEGLREIAQSVPIRYGLFHWAAFVFSCSPIQSSLDMERVQRSRLAADHSTER